MIRNSHLLRFRFLLFHVLLVLCLFCLCGKNVSHNLKTDRRGTQCDQKNPTRLISAFVCTLLFTLFLAGLPACAFRH